MKHNFTLLLALCAVIGVYALPLSPSNIAHPYGSVQNEPASPRSTTLFDYDWQFSQDGKHWRAVDLPHDWSIQGTFDIDAPANNDGGYLPTGKGYYKKKFKIDTVNPDKLYKLYFEGVYMDSEVKVNGHKVGGHPYGYTSFWCDITEAIRPGKNLVEVSADNSRQRNSRWYTGSGIYRHVWLVETGRTYIDPWSVCITKPDKELSASYHLQAHIVNPDNKDMRDWKVGFTLTTDNLYERFHTIWYCDTIRCQWGSALPENISERIFGSMEWTPDAPKVHKLEISLHDEKGNVVDRIVKLVGFSHVDYSTDGMRLKYMPVTINGACVHHDNGILGAASYDAAEWRKAQLLKDAGFNAVRCSHNPPSPAFLDACDRLGLMVIDEAFDGWRQAKVEHDYSELIDTCWQDDLGAMIMRDHHHPSIIAWSIGNEIIERKSPEAVETAAQLAGLCHELDPGRPVTSALAAWDDDWDIYDPLAAQLDIVGYNYMIHKAEDDHQRVPDRVMWQTESYPRDVQSNYRAVKDHPYILGDFVWTGIDYLGESGIGRHYYEGQVPGEHWERKLWPWHGAECGDIDLTGLRRHVSYERQVLYGSKPVLHMAVREPQGYYGEIRETMWGHYPMHESWTWPGWEGKPIDIEIVATAPEVELYLNDQLIGRVSLSHENGWRSTFQTTYRPGTLRCVIPEAYEWTTLTTASEPAAILLTEQPLHGYTGKRDVIFVLAEVLDSDGTVVPNSPQELTFSVDGDATILATGTADMTDPVSYSSPTRQSYQGRVLVAVRPGRSGDPIRLTATSPTLRPTAITIK